MSKWFARLFELKLVTQVALPLESVTVLPELQAKGVTLSANVTVPVGVPAPAFTAVTVTLKTTVSPVYTVVVETSGEVILRTILTAAKLTEKVAVVFRPPKSVIDAVKVPAPADVVLLTPTKQKLLDGEVPAGMTIDEMIEPLQSVIVA